MCRECVRSLAPIDPTYKVKDPYFLDFNKSLTTVNYPRDVWFMVSGFSQESRVCDSQGLFP